MFSSDFRLSLVNFLEITKNIWFIVAGDITDDGDMETVVPNELITVALNATTVVTRGQEMEVACLRS
jgi:hypothetical protein